MVIRHYRVGPSYWGATDASPPPGAEECPPPPHAKAEWGGDDWLAYDPVPESVSAFQARAAMAQAGILAAVEAAVLASGDPRAALAWEWATTWNRSSPMMRGLAADPAIDLDDAALDDLFRLAATISA